MKSQFDLVISQVLAAPSAPPRVGQNGGRPSITDKAAKPRRLWRHVESKVEGRAMSVEGYWISKLAFYRVRIEDRQAGLNDPIWGGARYILGSSWSKRLTPLPLTDHKHG
jgi:hypothetical protein